MTCQFCGREDGRIGDMTLHYRKHEIETLIKIWKALETLNGILEDNLQKLVVK